MCIHYHFFLINVRIKQHSTIVKDTLRVFAPSESVAEKRAKNNIREIYNSDGLRISITRIRQITNPGLENNELDFMGRTENNLLRFFQIVIREVKNGRTVFRRRASYSARLRK